MVWIGPLVGAVQIVHTRVADSFRGIEPKVSKAFRTGRKMDGNWRQ